MKLSNEQRVRALAHLRLVQLLHMQPINSGLMKKAFVDYIQNSQPMALWQIFHMPDACKTTLRQDRHIHFTHLPICFAAPNDMA